MKTYANRKLPQFQWIGNIVRVHWEEQPFITAEGENQWVYEEIVVPDTGSPEDALASGVPPEVASQFIRANFVRETNE